MSSFTLTFFNFMIPFHSLPFVTYWNFLPHGDWCGVFGFWPWPWPRLGLAPPPVKPPRPVKLPNKLVAWLIRFPPPTCWFCWFCGCSNSFWSNTATLQSAAENKHSDAESDDILVWIYSSISLKQMLLTLQSFNTNWYIFEAILNFSSLFRNRSAKMISKKYQL